MVDDLGAKSVSVSGNLHRFVVAAAHLAGRANAVRQPRHVDLLHHLLDALIGTAHQVGFGTLKDNFTRGQRSGPQLVFQSDNSVFVSRAIWQVARQGEHRNALDAFHGTLGPRKNQGDMRIGMGCEPFIAIKAPHAPFIARNGFKGSHVRAARPLRHELCAFPEVFQVWRQHLRQQVVLEIFTCEGFQDLNRRIRDAQRAHHAKFRLDEKVLKRILHRLRRSAVPAQRAWLVAHRMKLEIFESDLFHLAIRGVVNNRVEIAAKAVARLK